MPSGHGPYELHRETAARGLLGLDGRERLARHLVPAHAEVCRHLLHDRSGDERRGVVPAERAAVRMARRVQAIAREVGEVDAADEGALVVDDHELLVVAVHRPLAAVRSDPDSGVTPEPRQLGVDIAPAGPEERQGRPRPRQHVHLDALAELAQQVVEDHASVAPFERERRREEPSGEQHARARPAQLAHHRRQRIGTVHEHLDLVAVLRRGGRARPRTRVRHRARAPSRPVAGGVGGARRPHARGCRPACGRSGRERRGGGETSEGGAPRTGSSHPQRPATASRLLSCTRWYGSNQSIQPAASCSDTNDRRSIVCARGSPARAMRSRTYCSVASISDSP